jgi:hypothetical protein
MESGGGFCVNEKRVFGFCVVSGRVRRQCDVVAKLDHWALKTFPQLNGDFRFFLFSRNRRMSLKLAVTELTRRVKMFHSSYMVWETINTAVETRFSSSVHRTMPFFALLDLISQRELLKSILITRKMRFQLRAGVESNFWRCSAYARALESFSVYYHLAREWKAAADMLSGTR